MITVSYFRNILKDPEKLPETLELYQDRLPVRGYLSMADLERKVYHVTLNGRTLSGDEVDNLIPIDGSKIVCAEVPGIFVALLPAGAGIGATLLAAIGDFILVSALSIGLSYGIAALQGPTARPKYGKDANQIDNFQGIQDTAGNGYPIPYVYGKIRKGGHFLQSYERAIEGEDVPDGVTVLYTLLGLCVGPIQSVSKIQINGNPIETISNVQTDVRLGLSDQAFILGFGEVNSEAIKATPLLASEGTQTFYTIDEVDGFELTFRFLAGLYKQTIDGMSAYPVEFKIEYRAFGSSSPFYTEVRKKVSAKTRSPYKAQVKVADLERAKYEIRITRLTADDSVLNTSKRQVQSQSEVYALTEIRDDASTHPGIAMLALRQVPSSQLNSSVPTSYTCEVEGFNDIRIYTDETTYTTGYSTNPAWCCAHFLTTKKHGLGDRYTWANIDIASWLKWAASNDALVLDGKGGLRKRATFNFEGNSQIPGNRVLEIMTQGSGATLVKWGSKWRVVLDEPDEMVWTFNEGNVAAGSDRIDWIEQKLRANRIQASFQDEEKDYQRDSFSLPLPDLKQGDPYIDTSRTLEGVTSRAQVEGILTRLLLHNKLEDTQITLRGGLDSLEVRAGNIFGVNLPCTGIGVAGGRILAFDGTQTLLDLDQEVVLESGKQYEIVVGHLEGGSLDTRKIVSPAGTHSRVAVSDANWQHPLSGGDLYSLGETAVEKYRCIKASLSKDFEREITGIKYDPNVYTDDLTAGPTELIQSLPDPRIILADVTDLLLTERQEFSQDGTLLDVVDVDWTPPIASTLAFFEIYARELGTSAWELKGTTSNRHFELKPIQSPGFSLEVTVVPVTTSGIRKSPTQTPRIQLTTLGVLTQPPTLANLRAFIIDGTLVAQVDPAPAGSLGPGGFYRWKIGSSWTNARDIIETAAPQLELKSYSRGAVSLLVKAVNSVGNESPEAASTSLTLYGQIEENVILTQSEEPGWSGTKLGLTVNGSNRLTLYEPAVSVVYAPQPPEVRHGPRYLSFGYPPPTARVVLLGYYTTGVIDVSGGQSVRARADVQYSFSPISIGLGTFADANFAFSDPKANIPFSGSESDKVTVTVEYRVSTTTNVESSFTPWAPHSPRAEIAMKYIQFRLKVEVATDAYSVEIETMKISIDLPEKWFNGEYQQVSAGSFTVTYPANYFVAVKRLLLTVIGGAAGDTPRVTAQAGTNKETSFTAEIRNAAGALTTGTVHFEALGY